MIGVTIVLHGEWPLEAWRQNRWAGLCSWAFAINVKIDEHSHLHRRMLRMRVAWIEIAVFANSRIVGKEKEEIIERIFNFMQKNKVKISISDVNLLNIEEKSFILPNDIGECPDIEIGDRVLFGGLETYVIVSVTGFRQIEDEKTLYFYTAELAPMIT